MYIDSRSAIDALPNVVSFFKQDRLILLVGMIALAILLASTAQWLYHYYQNQRTLLHRVVLSSPKVTPFSNQEGATPTSSPQPSPRSSLKDANQELALEIRQTESKPASQIDFLIALQTHVHEIIPGKLYLGDYRGFLSIDPEFQKQHSMLDAEEDMIDSFKMCDESLTLDDAGILYEEYAEGAKNGCSLLNIKHVISVTQFKTDLKDWSSFVPNLEGLGVDRFQIPIDDDEFAWDKLLIYLEDAFERIDMARLNNEPLFIHCVEGKSRSVSLLIAYLINRCGVTYEEALTFIQSKRPQADPKPSFVTALKAYQEELRLE